MNKFEKFRQCNAMVGLKFKAAPDSATPEMIFEIVEQGLKDADGFNAVRLRYSDGSEEVAAIAVLQEGVQNHGVEVL